MIMRVVVALTHHWIVPKRAIADACTRSVGPKVHLN
jgi:hypothetical protein